VLIGTGDLALSLARDEAHPHRHEESCRAVREACRKAGIPCAIFTTGAEQAAARAAEGYDMVVPANDIGVVAQGFVAAMQEFRKGGGGKTEG
jgi:2-keto-3-deoxy-L-rhamnonate aldolase RhmA